MMKPMSPWQRASESLCALAAAHDWTGVVRALAACRKSLEEVDSTGEEHDRFVDTVAECAGTAAACGRHATSCEILEAAAPFGLGLLATAAAALRAGDAELALAYLQSFTSDRASVAGVVAEWSGATADALLADGHPYLAAAALDPSLATLLDVELPPWARRLPTRDEFLAELNLSTASIVRHGYLGSMCQRRRHGNDDIFEQVMAHMDLTPFVELHRESADCARTLLRRGKRTLALGLAFATLTRQVVLAGGAAGDDALMASHGTLRRSTRMAIRIARESATNTRRERTELVAALERLDDLLGATRADVAASLKPSAPHEDRRALAEAVFGCAELPFDLDTWFAWHDGQHPRGAAGAKRGPVEVSATNVLPHAPGRLLSAREALDIWRQQTARLTAGKLPGSWDPSWVPLLNSENGDLLVWCPPSGGVAWWFGKGSSRHMEAPALCSFVAWATEDDEHDGYDGLCCGNALCKTPINASPSPPWPFPCPSCDAALYPADVLDRMRASERRESFTTLMRIAHGRRIAVHASDLED